MTCDDCTSRQATKWLHTEVLQLKISSRVCFGVPEVSVLESQQYRDKLQGQEGGGEGGEEGDEGGEWESRNGREGEERHRSEVGVEMKEELRGC